MDAESEGDRGGVRREVVRMVVEFIVWRENQRDAIVADGRGANFPEIPLALRSLLRYKLITSMGPCYMRCYQLNDNGVHWPCKIVSDTELLHFSIESSSVECKSRGPHASGLRPSALWPNAIIVEHADQ